MKQNELDEKWLSEIRDEMSEMKVDVPADGWNRLVAETAPAIIAPKKRLRPIWYGAAASVLLCLLLGGGMWYLSPKIVLPEEVETIAEDIRQSAEDAHVSVESYAAVIESAKNTLADNSKPAKTLYVSEMVEASENEEIAVLQKDNDVDLTESIEESSSAETKREDIENDATISLENNEEKALLMAMDNSSRKHHSNKRVSGRWGMGVRLGGGGNIDLSTGGQDYGYMDSPDISFDEYHGAQETILGKDKVVDSDNHFSWSIGLTASRQFVKGLSVESGLVYTRLDSDVKMSHSGDQHQRLHYLGIPLKLNVSIKESLKWKWYLSAGTMVERCIAAMRGDKSFSNNNWQCSANVAGGVQYNVSKHIGLYLEPGVNYYFDDKSDVPSLRSERPFSFNLHLGIRFNY